MQNLPFTLDLLFACVSLYLLKWYISYRHVDRKIPGPAGLPVIGNLFDIPREDECRVFSGWARTYGDICTVKALGKQIVILNCPQLAHDMLMKKASIYSDRPHFTMASELVGWEDAVVMLPANSSRFKSYRKYMHQAIGSRNSVTMFNDMMDEETMRCLRDLLVEPNNFEGPIRRAVGTIILMITHGYRPSSSDDELVKTADDATDQLSHLLAPGNFLVDTLPFLKYTPSWVPFQKLAVEWKKTLYSLTDGSFAFVKEQIASGTARPSLVSNLLMHQELSTEDEKNVKWAASSLYSAGIDNPVNALATFFLAMTIYPDVQLRAQKEIDCVVGSNRIPDFSDRSQLPYVNALVKELIRWGPTAPLGAPHCVTQDDVHNGYFIPKGTTIIANIWHFLHDPKVYPNPEILDPTRHISRPGSPAQKDPYDVCFGYGRRICPGAQLADSIMYIFVAKILCMYNIKKPSANATDPRCEFTSGVLVKPKPFQTRVTLRYEKAHLARLFDSL
ncbi:cytochrome P450 [Stereum hirsutum FP-91666 SS1]|uniref:cytochrome P450 n=1 Tax=Stereum hirsutum (strain FP-91666) TaxID=721885 RepID=UPI000444931A|nr:cytochrome P450 [Stereum hirsutum FP-91666 SS1]EIM82842.1 cytochrome P450 [Stereum hirsutum FP-91666 SS1]